MSGYETINILDLMESVGDYEDLGHCDQCGDDISKYTVNIE